MISNSKHFPENVMISSFWKCHMTRSTLQIQHNSNIKIPIPFLTELEKNPKNCMKEQKTPNSQSNL